MPYLVKKSRKYEEKVVGVDVRISDLARFGNI